MDIPPCSSSNLQLSYTVRRPARHHIQTLPQLISLLVPADKLIKRGGVAISGFGTSATSLAIPYWSASEWIADIGWTLCPSFYEIGWRPPPSPRIPPIPFFFAALLGEPYIFRHHG
jgi:hypothetical protein